MAYKFQLGKAKLSGSIETAQAITSQGGLTVNGDVDLDAGVINNAELQNSSVMFNGVTVALGATGSFGTDAVSEGSTNKYYLDSRARAAVSVTDNGGDGSLSYNSATGVISYTGPSAAEARAHFSAVDVGGDGAFSYDAGTGAFTYTGPSASEVRKHLSAGDFLTYDSGSGVISVGSAFTGSARSVVSALTGAAYQNGNLQYNSATGQITLQPVEENWVRQRLSAANAVKYNSASGQISLQLSGTSLAQNADGLKADLKTQVGAYDNSGSIAYNVDDGRITFNPVAPSWVKGHFSAGPGLDYDGNGQFSVGNLEVTNGMLAGSIENGKLVNSSVTVNGTAGEVTVVGSPLALGGTATISLPSTITKDLAFSGQVTINKLNVTGTLTTVNTENLEIKDARILMASGSTGWATDVGFDFGSHAGHGTLLTAEVDLNGDGVGAADNVLSSSLPLVAPSMKAGTFYGNFVGASILGIVTEGASTATISANVTRANNASQVLTLPSAPAVGQEHRIKCVVADASSPVITIQPASGAKLEGVVDAQITLESFGAAVSLVWGGSSEGWMVF